MQGHVKQALIRLAGLCAFTDTGQSNRLVCSSVDRHAGLCFTQQPDEQGCAKTPYSGAGLCFKQHADELVCVLNSIQTSRIVL